MKKRIRTMLAVVVLSSGLSPFWPSTIAHAQTVFKDAIVGTWATADGNLVIEMYDAGGTYAARFIYGALIVEADGTTLMKDEKNPDPSLRSRSLAEVDFVSGLVWDAGDQRWENGSIYQANAGRSGSARATIEGDTLNLRAYRGTPIAGRTLIFQRRAN
jgi:uncharacterized protein (DUF2147 family)